MTDAGFFRGTSAEQDNRFSDKEKKLLKQMRFGENVCKKVDMSKIKVDVLRPWICKRVEDLLGMEDDVIEEFVVNQLEANQFPDGRRIQINLTGFLNGKNARIFTAELWDMLLSAQEQSTGIPASILESKQEEIKKRNEEQEKLTETLKKTVSLFNEKLKNSDSSPPLPSSRSGIDQPSSSPASRSSTLNIKREKTSPEPNRDLDSSTATINRRRDDGGKRNYRSRRSSSPSSPRRSRSRSRDRDRDRRDYRRDRDRGHSPPRGGGDRRRDRSRSPVKPRRSPVLPRSSFRDNRSRSRDRDRDRDSRSNAPIGGNRRYSDYRDRDNFSRPSRDTTAGDRDRDRRRSRSREDNRDRSRGLRRDLDYAQNGSSSHFRQPPSPLPPQQHSRHSSRERELRRVAPPEDDFRGTTSRRGMSTERELNVGSNLRRRERSPPQEPVEENSEPSVDSAEGSPVAKRSKKEKKKKEKKKHRKHKKGKKSKKSKNGTASHSGSEEEDDDDGNSASDNDDDNDRLPERRGLSSSASSYLKFIDSAGGIQQGSDDLERRLREKALASLKKATSSR